MQHLKFGVLRVINARLWFATREEEFQPLCGSTWSSDSRENAFSKARVLHGLCVEIPASGFVPKLPQDRATPAQPSPQSPQNEPPSALTAPQRREHRAGLVRSLREQVEAATGRVLGSRSALVTHLEED